jgi:predicted ATPase
MPNGEVVLDAVHADLQSMLAAKQLEPYIRHIRFPRFRGLRDGTRVEFLHPVTALVGPNGTNKTAILRALQGAPENANLGQYWFSTNLDPIKQEDRHRFIYGYHAKSVNHVVEVVKSRINREGDPDYFEPARPIVQDGMARMPPVPKGNPMPADRTATRWRTIKKNVVYLDFRSELSAYDKFFYHFPYRKGSAPAVKKAHIRRRAAHVSAALTSKTANDSLYQKERIVEPAVSLSLSQVKAISTILGREYSSIDVITHSYFDVVGATVVLRSGGFKYSEAFAGSGEFAIVMLVKAITEAEPRSLILLDEPEVSLHPGAQRQLMLFVAGQAKSKRHQVVVSTHSPAIVADLPSAAIKVFLRNDNDGMIDLVSQETEPIDAFFRLGMPSAERWTVYVEDRLAVDIVKASIRPLGEVPNARVSVEVLPGGAATIKGQFLPNLALTNRQRCLILLDGDQRPEKPLMTPAEVPDSALEVSLKDALEAPIKLPLDRGASGSGGQKTDLLRRVYSWAYENLDFLPGQNPESLLLEMEGNEGDVPDNGKDSWVDRTRVSLGLADWETVHAADIIQEQKRALAKVSPDCVPMADIREKVKKFLANS